MKPKLDPKRHQPLGHKAHEAVVFVMSAPLAVILQRTQLTGSDSRREALSRGNKSVVKVLGGTRRGGRGTAGQDGTGDGGAGWKKTGRGQRGVRGRGLQGGGMFPRLSRGLEQSVSKPSWSRQMFVGKNLVWRIQVPLCAYPGCSLCTETAKT